MPAVSKEYIAARVEALTPGVTPHRGVAKGGEELALAMQARIADVLSADTDALFHLAGVAINKAAQLVTELLSIAASMQASVYAQGTTRVAPPVAVGEFAAATFAEPSTAAQRASFIINLEAKVKALTNGRQVEHSTQYLETRASGLSTQFSDKLATLANITRNILLLVDEYYALDLRSAKFSRQLSNLQQAAVALGDDAESVLDALILLGALRPDSNDLDVTSPKYSGSATATGIVRAELLGTTLPIAYGSQQQAIVAVDDPPNTTVTVTIGAGAAPSVAIPLSTALVDATESVSVIKVNPVVLQLKPFVHAASVVVSYYASGTLQTTTSDGIGNFPLPYSGSVNHTTGALNVTLSPVADVGTFITVTYRYSPVGSLVGYNTFNILRDNTLVSVAAATNTSGYFTVDALQTALAAVLAGQQVTTNYASGVFTITSNSAGSSRRLRLPVVTAPVRNLAFGGSAWTTPPTTLNAAVGAAGAALGADSPTATITGNYAELFTDRVLVGSGTSAVQTGAKGTITVPEAALAGDVVLVSSPYVATHRIVTKLSATTAAVTPDILFSVAADPGTLVATENIAFDVTRNKLGIRTLNATVSGLLNVTSANLGLSGAVKNKTKTFTLGALRGGVTLRSGDIVYSGVTEVGALYDAGSLREYVSPIPTSLIVHGLGNRKFFSLLAALNKLRPQLDLLFTSQLPALVTAARTSSSGAGAFVEELSKVLTTLAALADALAAYQFNTVNSVRQLLAELTEAGHTKLVQYLLSLNIRAAVLCTGKDLGEDSTIHDALVELSALYANGSTELEYATSSTPNDDYGA